MELSGRSNTFSRLKVGDYIVVHHKLDQTIKRVDALTKEQIIIGGARYRKSDGQMVVTLGTYRPYITIPKETDVVQIRQSQYAKKMLSYLHNLKCLSYVQAVQINKILSADKLIDKKEDE